MSQKRIWQLKKQAEDSQLIGSLAVSLGISKVMAAILINRGLTTPEEVRSFLYSSLPDLQNPAELPSLLEGAARISRAIQNGESILVYGDYDVDGITGTVLLTDLLRRLGGKVDYYIPDRLAEGYGLNIPAIIQAGKEGIDLIVSVDCGIASVAEAACAAECGVDLVITDHHQPPAELPQALAVINPKLAAVAKPWYDLAGVGVAFKLGQAVAAQFSRENLCDDYLALVALGTIADIVPLTGENRILVKAGLHCLNNQLCQPGIQALLDSAGLKPGKISTGQVGFVLAPRLNASGRLGKADLAVTLLLGTDLSQAREICQVLEEENKTRRAMEEQILKEAVELLEKGGEPAKNKIILLASPNWHPGVIGIVASRLTERYYRPTILLNLAEGIAKGSARSIPGFNLYKALEQVNEHLLTFGGHEMAAGLSLSEEKLPLVRKRLQDYADTILDERSFIPVLQVDAEMSLQDINEQLIREMELLAPYGNGNPAPLLITRGNRLEGLREVGQDGKHLKLKVGDEHRLFQGIGFRLATRKEEAASWEKCDLAFIPELNSFNGNTQVQLNIKDMKDYLEPDDPSIPLPFLERLYWEGEIWLEDHCYRDILNQEEFCTKIVGVTFADRQQEIRRITDGEAVELRREADNVYDQNAIGVYYNNTLIGYLNTHLARNLAPALNQGISYQAYVTQVTGRNKGKLGVNICVQKAAGKKSQEELAKVREKLALCSPSTIENEVKKAILGQAAYREKQQEVLQLLKAGHNTLAIFGTGRGKSAVFQTRAACLALLENKVTLLVYPLRSLVNDQYHRLQEKLSSLGIRVSAINGSMSMHAKKDFFKDFSRGKVDIVLTTPEFLAFHLDKFKIMAERIGLFVVDEAHHLAAGKRRGYRLLGQSWRELGKPLALAVTATADDDTAQWIVDTLDVSRVVVEKHVRKNLVLVDARTEKDKLQYILKLLDIGERMVIYVNSRLQAYQLANDLRFYYPAAKDEIGFYHGGLNSEYRVTLEKMYREGSLRVMVTTSAFGEGIDIPDIKHVVLYHLCFSLTEFNQLAGRAGRDNEEAKIHLLFNEKDKKLNELILDGAAPTRKVLGKFYLYLREQETKETPLQLTNRELQEAMQKQGIKNFREQTASACLAILEELGLLLREVEGKNRYIHLVPPPPGKLDLADSVRYLEGRDEWEDFQCFAQYIFKEEKETIVTAVNRPIFPVHALQLK
jgi:single-stranded-DNA-specific exonuclease